MKRAATCWSRRKNLKAMNQTSTLILDVLRQECEKIICASVTQHVVFHCHSSSTLTQQLWLVFSAHGQSEMTKAEATCPSSSESRTQISVPMLALTLGCIKQTSECSFMDAASSLGGQRGCWSGNHRTCDRMEIAKRKDKVQTSSKDSSEEVSSTRNRFSGTFSLTVLNSRQEKLFHQDNTQSYDLQLNWLATLHIDFSCLGIIFQVSCNSTAPSEQQ